MLLPLAFAACAAGPPSAADAPPGAFVHGSYASLRPAMVAVLVEPGDPEGPALARAIYHGLIDKDYGVLALGAPVGAEVGRFRVRLTADSAEAEFIEPRGTGIYRYRVERSADAETVAARLLEALPRK